MCCTGRPWPIAFGGGVGLGMGYANCQHEFNDPYNLRARLTKVSCRNFFRTFMLYIVSCLLSFQGTVIYKYCVVFVCAGIFLFTVL